MSGIGYSSPDWGMAGYYAQEDEVQLQEEYQAYLESKYRDIYEQNKDSIILFVAFQSNQYRMNLKETGINDYDLQGWREFLMEATTSESDEIMLGVMWAIKNGEDFSFCDEIDGLADKWIENQQSEIQSKLLG